MQEILQFSPSQEKIKKFPTSALVRFSSQVFTSFTTTFCINKYINKIEVIALRVVTLDFYA